MRRALHLHWVLSAVLFGLAAAEEAPLQTNFPADKYGIVVARLDDELRGFLQRHFGDFRIPPLSELSADMLHFYYENQPTTAHPAHCSADFNRDGIRDHAFILRDWAGQAILAILHGIKSEPSRFDLYIIHGVRGYQDDYLLFASDELYRGNFEKDGFRVQWSDEHSTYLLPLNSEH